MATLKHRPHKPDDPAYFVLSLANHRRLELPRNRGDWHLTPGQAVALVLLATTILTGLVVALILSQR